MSTDYPNFAFREKEERMADLGWPELELLHPLTALDVRRLVKAEEELSVSR